MANKGRIFTISELETLLMEVRGDHSLVLPSGSTLVLSPKKLFRTCQLTVGLIILGFAGFMVFFGIYCLIFPDPNVLGMQIVGVLLGGVFISLIALLNIYDALKSLRYKLRITDESITYKNGEIRFDQIKTMKWSEILNIPAYVKPFYRYKRIHFTLKGKKGNRKEINVCAYKHGKIDLEKFWVPLLEARTGKTVVIDKYRTENE